MRAFAIRTAALAHKELLHFLRDYQAIYLAIGMPLLLVVLFGYAVSFDLERVAIAVVDEDRSAASRRLVAALEASEVFVVAAQLPRPAQAEALLRRNAAKGAVVIPRGFARHLARGSVAPYQFLIDGSDGTVARLTLGYAAGLSQRQALDLLRQAGLGSALPLAARVRTFFNPELRSARYIVPGLVALVLAIMCVLITALTVAREWERGSMEQLFSTPVGRLPVVLGKLLPYIALGYLQMLLVVAAGAWLFDVPFAGSFWLLLLATTLFLVCALGQGLLISVVTRNQQVAAQVGAVSGMLPSLLLSGFLFPIENMAWPLQLIARIVPARYMVESLRGILLKGFGVAQLWPQLLAMAILGALLIAASAARFRRRLD